VIDSNEGHYDKRNTLNDLTGKQWLKLTRSYWISQKCKDDKFAFQHPAPFLIRDIESLISMFTKTGMRVLDPFSGLGTTLIAAHNLKRCGIGIELNPEYYNLTLKRLKELNIEPDSDIELIQGDSLDELSKITQEIDYCVTSPPYHNILRNKGGGIRNPQDAHRTGARTGVEYYSDDTRDLGNQLTYESFLRLLRVIMKEVYRLLRPGGYCTIIISDFTVDKVEISVQSDIVSVMTSIDFEFSGTTVLIQETKPLYPFGYPYAYKINHHHQNLITFRKKKSAIRQQIASHTT